MKISGGPAHKNILFVVMRRMGIMDPNNTRRGYALRSILKPAGSLFWEACGAMGFPEDFTTRSIWRMKAGASL